MDIRKFYTDKTVLLAGTTGFVGKVLLEKFVRSLPCVKRIYVMIRSKKSVTLQERLETEILNSEIFSRLYADVPGIKQLMKEKIFPVAGDLIMDKLGMDASIRSMLTHECDVIINCAASVDFNEFLLDAIQINFSGCLRMLELAKECEKL